MEDKSKTLVVWGGTEIKLQGLGSLQKLNDWGYGQDTNKMVVFYGYSTSYSTSYSTGYSILVTVLVEQLDREGRSTNTCLISLQ